MSDNDRTIAIGNPKKSVGHIIHFVHVPTMDTCHFKAMITAWEDLFKQEWNSYDTVGRMDPIRTYKRTSRIINFTIEIPSYDSTEASFNLLQIQKLIQMSYPTFEHNVVGAPQAATSPANSEARSQAQESKNASIFSEQKESSGPKTVSHMISPPFFKIKFSNWLNDPSKDPGMSNNDAVMHKENADTKIKTDIGSGLYGTIESVKFAPDFTSGFYGANDMYDDSAATRSEKTLIPATLKLDIVFNVLHTNDLGYLATTGKARSPSFPYNADTIYNKMKQKIKVI